ncbi:GNAT family N-acetyltransferase [Paenibacillus sp. 1011MAR3C5]|uniref:GNAT family N-acetyltransferase n=1 Tax=Paenibacillus sp. 1011MAR3C5 TaxID=1675787 RepID=UPI000E6C0E54|nr:GNAT family N-acetyltransferase [Paenibacillus sp. 1011MAR3C5]RJE90292.1 GNAT family N-acetyltransferase [Paenibacillus sp. 1011MAR3C5]
MEQASVRLIRHDERNALLELYKHLNEQDPDLADSEELRLHWEAMMQDDSLNIIVVEQDGVLAASCVVHILKNLTRGARPYALIENVVTHSRFRRRGLGRIALNKAKEIAEQCGCYKIMLLTSRADDSVHRFYQTAGYRGDVKTGYVLKL